MSLEIPLEKQNSECCDSAAANALLACVQQELCSTAQQQKSTAQAVDARLPEGDQLDKEIAEVSQQLAQEIFSAASSADKGDILRFDTKAASAWKTTATLHVDFKGKPEPVSLTGDSVTVTPSLDEKAFDNIFLRNFVKSSIGQDFGTPYLPVKLALGTGQELHGSLRLLSF